MINDPEENIDYLSSFDYNFSLKDRFIYVNKNENFFKFKTPFLKILKPVHSTLNKKKTIAKKYIILEINNESSFNNELGNFIFIINKIHEISQENIKKKSIEWFNTEFDDFGLDIKVKRPIDQNKDNEFIRIIIPNNEILEDKISKLSKNIYISCEIVFKGLKVSNDYIIEEWELIGITTQEEYEEEQKNNILDEKSDIIESLIEDNIDEVINNQENNEKIEDIKNLENIENNIENTIDITSIINNYNLKEKTKEKPKEKIKGKTKESNILRNTLIKKSGKKLIFI